MRDAPPPPFPPPLPPPRRNTRGAAQAICFCRTAEELLAAVNALPAPGTAGRKVQLQAIIVHVGLGRFSFVARNPQQRVRAALPFPPAAVAGARAPGAGAPSQFRAPVPLTDRFSMDIDWQRLRGGGAAFLAQLQVTFKSWMVRQINAAPIAGAPAVVAAPGATDAALTAALVPWINWMAVNRRRAHAAPRNAPLLLTLYEARQILRDAGFGVQNVDLRACRGVIEQPALRELFAPHLRAVLGTRVRGNEGALVPAASPRGSDNVPSFLRHGNLCFTRHFDNFSFRVPGFHAATDARLKAALLSASCVIAELRTIGFDGE
jgi:hypothetical protein